jgi:hypothetical protein
LLWTRYERPVRNRAGCLVGCPASAVDRAICGAAVIGAFAIVLVALAFFMPGVQVASVPIPFEYVLAIAYLALYNPKIPQRYLTVFALAIIYLTVVAAINATSEAGSARDFLYALLFLGELGLFCTFRDLFDRGYGDLVMTGMVWCGGFNLLLMVLQALNVAGIDQSLKGLWTAPLYVFARGPDDLVHADVIQSRPYGLLPGFNIAGLALYLTFRGAYVYSRRSLYRLLCLFAVALATARMLVVLFLLYEVVLPLFNFRRDSRAARFSLVAMVLCTAGIAITVMLNPSYFLVSFYDEITNQGLETNYSITNRLETLNWALDNWVRIVTIGGVPSEEFRNFSRAVDSELILRSMQFGLAGFVLVVTMVYGYFHKYRSYDTYFLLAAMLWTSLTSSAASNFVLIPFLFVYGFACRADAKSRRRPSALIARVATSEA